MNTNIEVIVPDKMAAVKFSWIPFISEIQYTPGDGVPAYSEPLRITDYGVFLLNKDHPCYESTKKLLRTLIRLSYKQLYRKHQKLSQKKCLDTISVTYKLFIEAELERREKEKRRR